MTMQTWTFPHARPPGPGPWEKEPDKAQWVDPATSLDCLVVRAAHHGAFCGYVGLPPGHPWYDQDPFSIRVVAHGGGVNYGARCRDDDPEPAVCHVPLPGRPADVYWIGFDCSHEWDLQPTREARMKVIDPHLVALDKRHRVYRTFGYVKNEVRLLALQAWEHAGVSNR